jgi:hypothetical protein
LHEKGTVARKCQTLRENAKSWGIIPHSPDEAAILMNSFDCRQSDFSALITSKEQLRIGLKLTRGMKEF